MMLDTFDDERSCQPPAVNRATNHARRIRDQVPGPAGPAGPGAAGVAVTLPAVLALAAIALAAQTALQIFDNLDTALPSTAAAVCAVLALAPSSAPLRAPALAGCGASLGILLWNLPPARIYLGNAGSTAVATTVSFLLAGTALAALEPGVASIGTGPGGRPALRSGDVALLAVALPLFWPLLDLAVVSVRRLRRGVPHWTGGRDHTTHALARTLRSDRAAAAVLLAHAAAMCWLAMQLRSGVR